MSKLREEVLAAKAELISDSRFDECGELAPAIRQIAGGCWLQGATGTDSPLLRKALFLLEHAHNLLQKRGTRSTSIDEGLKEIREVQESIK